MLNRVLAVCLLGLVASLFMACDDGDTAKESTKSSREFAQSEAKTKQCAISLLTSTCSADNQSIIDVKCDGVSLTVDAPCPSGTKCITINEIVGPVAYCVPANDVPECVVSSCDASLNTKIKRCEGGKFKVEDCGSGEVCRVSGKDAADKDLGAKCEKKYDGSSQPEEEDLDPCKQAGHGQISADACSADNKQAIYTCSDGFVITETCHPTKCEVANLRTTFKSWAEEATYDDLKTTFNMMASAMPDKDLHACHLNSILEMLKVVIKWVK
ncbi:MAG: hypothetical protein WC966_08525 [Bradymonadales bacterium]